MHEEPGALEAEGAERVNRLEAEERPPFAGRRAAGGRRGELEAPAEIERQHAETLPRAVGGVGPGGDAAEGEPALQLAVHLLVHPTPTHERPEGSAVDGLVRSDGAVLVVPIVRVEEVELEVLRRLVPDVATVEDHPAPPLPAGDLDRVLGAGDVVGQPSPGPRLEDPPLQPKPGMKRHLDRVLRPRARQAVEDIAAEKGSIHAEFEPIGASERRAELREEVAEEAPRALAVVDVARPILDPQDLAALRLVRRDRVVARHLAPVRIEATLRPRDLQPRRDDRAIDVDREPPLPGVPDGAGGDARVHPLQRWQMAHAKCAEPAADRAGRRELAQSAEAPHDRIAVEVAQVADPASAAQQERQHNEHEPDHAIVRRGQRRHQLVPQQPEPAIAPEPPPHQLQAGVRGEAGYGDVRAMLAVARSPGRWRAVGGRRWDGGGGGGLAGGAGCSRRGGGVPHPPPTPPPPPPPPAAGRRLPTASPRLWTPVLS